MKNQSKIKFKEVETNINFTNVPLGGLQVYHPEYRTMTISEIIRHSNISNEYVPYGYNYFILVRSSGTIHAYTNEDIS